MAEKPQLAANLAAQRKRWRYTQARVAELIGVHPMAVSQWERGVNAPDEANLAALGRLYGCSPGELRYGEDYDVSGALSINPRITFGRRIRLRREAARITQRAAAKAVGVTADVFRSWESNDELPNSEQTYRIASLLRNTVRDLLDQTTPVDHPRLARNITARFSESAFEPIRIAQQLRVHPDDIGDWMDGLRTPSAGQLWYLARALKTTPELLLYGDRFGKTIEVDPETEAAGVLRRHRQFDALLGFETSWHSLTTGETQLLKDAATDTVIGLPKRVTEWVDAFVQNLENQGLDAEDAESARELLLSYEAFTFYLGESHSAFPTDLVIEGMELLGRFIQNRIECHGMTAAPDALEEVETQAVSKRATGGSYSGGQGL